MIINGVLYTFTKDKKGGFEVFADGGWIGWTAGNITDAKNLAKDIARTAA